MEVDAEAGRGDDELYERRALHGYTYFVSLYRRYRAYSVHRPVARDVRRMAWAHFT